ncbi:hypothetical protein R3P38DRAFT_1711747 [Favolaschia claudopus]|uniref:Velvet domain-containing protein n=1 Tax=Favolaschia claudopus TaxID=2862362 RepID=A0AAW0AAL5_9AGAR
MNSTEKIAAAFISKLSSTVLIQRLADHDPPANPTQYNCSATLKFSTLLLTAIQFMAMNIQWGIQEIQSPIAARKSSNTGTPRPLDPPPVARLICTVDPRQLRGVDLVCSVDLFRLPDAPITRHKYSYFGHDGTFDSNQPRFVLYCTDNLPHDPEFRVGNHLIYESAKETHLLHRQTHTQPVEITSMGLIVFAFPGLGVLQTGKYMLRYTLFNIAVDRGPPLATCYGAPFQVHSVTSFPGVRPHTQLSLALASLKVPGFTR